VSNPHETSNPAPNTLEGFAVLHQFLRLRRDRWRACTVAERATIVQEAADAMAAMARHESGDSAFFTQVGHKGDLIALHFRRSLDDLAAVEATLANLRLSEFFEQSSSYLSVIEIGLYEATVKLHRELAEQGVEPHSPRWRAATDAELAVQREKLGARLWSKIPARRYLCFYPMNKRRQGADNWYSLSLQERQRLMHEHGLIGRRYAGQVNQVISSSIGFDDWEWGVDLFADNPLVFKHLVYEMRFDESSARYAEFGSFCVGIRFEPAHLDRLLEVPRLA